MRSASRSLPSKLQTRRDRDGWLSPAGRSAMAPSQAPRQGDLAVTQGPPLASWFTNPSQTQYPQADLPIVDSAKNPLRNLSTGGCAQPPVDCVDNPEKGPVAGNSR